MAQIQGPNGNVAKVDDEGRLKTFTVSQPEDKHINLEGGVFSIFIEETATGANDYFFYFKNNGTSDLYITDIRSSSSVATTLFYDFVSGTPTYTSETAITPTNRNLGSSAVLTATANRDANITGLTNEGTVFFEELPVVDTLYHLRTSSNILVPQGKAIAIRREAATGAVTCLVSVADSALS